MLKTTLALGLAAFATTAIAGPAAAPSKPTASEKDGWCSWLKNQPGTLYSNDENPYVQKIRLEGRFQYQVGYLDGSDVNGRNYNEGYDEFRRVRLGMEVGFLQYFGAKVVLNMVADERNASGGGPLDWGYADFDEALLSFDLGKALGGQPFDKLKLSYGRKKFTFGQESHTSSTKLLTVERSAISNKVYGGYRPTGVTLDATKGKWSFGAGLFSSTTDGEDNESFNGWQDGVIYYLNAGYQVNKQLSLGADFVYNDANVAAGEDSVLDYQWATSLNAKYDAGSWGVIGDFIYGDNGDGRLGHGASRGGDFWGVMVMPYCWLYKDKLQAVAQYQYQGSDQPEGVRVNSRYGRARGTGGDSGIDVNSGRGDSHHSVYGGLNYYICGHNAKIQAGIEYQTMDTPKGDFDTITYLVGFRFNF